MSAAHSAAWRAKEVGRKSWSHIWNRYGLTRDQWTALLIEQSGRCAICGEPMRVPHVDHDHGNGTIRGLLCRPCNSALSYVERPGWVEAAREYLQRTEQEA